MTDHICDVEEHDPWSLGSSSRFGGLADAGVITIMLCVLIAMLVVETVGRGCAAVVRAIAADIVGH